MNKKLAVKIKELPQKPGVYLFKDASGRILYIGKAINLKNRVESHFKNIDSSKGQFLQKTVDIDFIKTEDENQALILEDQLIKKYQPRYNVQRRDDKSYLWVSFSDDEWPRVFVTHRLKIENCKLKISPVGPFTNGKELKQVMRGLRKIMPYRTCKNSYDKPCLQWHLGLCPAHAPDCHSRESGNPGSCRPELVSGHGSRVKPGMTKIEYSRSLNTLRQLLRLYAGEPIRTEAYDISNIQGTNATGSMIVFKGAKPNKAEYRKFRIKTVRGANDVAMLKEVLSRRLNHKEWPSPDLMLIDGGRPQLNAIAPLTQRGVGGFNIPTISLAKKEEEIYTIYSNKTLHLGAVPVSFRLIFQAVRNEAHRFAISYYRHLHGKKFKHGITPKKTGN